MARIVPDFAIKVPKIIPATKTAIKCAWMIGLVKIARRFAPKKPLTIIVPVMETESVMIIGLGENAGGFAMQLP